MKLALGLFAVLCAGIYAAQAADSKIAAGAVNALGVDLYRASAHGEDNLLLSPYSIQNALAMTYAGADGDTRAEMQRVLHFPEDDNTLHESFAALARDLAALAAGTIERAKEEQAGHWGGPTSPVEIHLANRLFAQRGCEFRESFLALVKERYGASLAEVDYTRSLEDVRTTINHWVEEQTDDHLHDVIPMGALTPRTRLTLVNAFYLRAPWVIGFKEKLTKSEPFLVHGREALDAPMMTVETGCGYRKEKGFQIVSRSFSGKLQFLILLPDDPAGLAAVERQVTPELLAGCARLRVERLILHLPRFRVEPPTLPLRESLKILGLKTAFDEPPGSANFDRMAARKPGNYLAIDTVLHKTVISVNETGSEAAGASASGIRYFTDAKPEPSKRAVRVDHPFLFAIQETASGACLFLGRVTDPR